MHCEKVSNHDSFLDLPETFTYIKEDSQTYTFIFEEERYTLKNCNEHFANNIRTIFCPDEIIDEGIDEGIYIVSRGKRTILILTTSDPDFSLEAMATFDCE